MPYLTISMDPLRGPLLDCLVGVSAPRAEALKKAGQPVPSPVQIRALIDTGATGSSIDASALAPLHWIPTGTVPIITPSTGTTPHIVNHYDVSLVIPHPRSGFCFNAIAVFECQLASQGIQALFGRNALKHCLFAYNGQAGIYTLAF